jgi:iron complex outermembrane receptor protein
MKHIKKRKLCTALAAAMGASMTISLPVAAQQLAQSKERIEVTGSNIKRVDQEGPNPVAVIRREDLQRAAGQNLTEVLGNLSAAVGGFSEGSNAGNTFAPGTAGVSLRGLGPNATLVLINGRRVANYGFAQMTGTAVAFVDLNAIPVSAIERIDILKAGASAIYGSDAIAGVINIILRKDFQGIEATAGYGTSSESDADETRGTLTLGYGDLAKQRFNVMATMDWYKRDPLFGPDRDISRTADYRRFYGGIDFRSPSGSPGTWNTAGRGGFTTNTVFPGCPAESIDQALNALGTCAFNFMPAVMTVAETERKTFFTRGVFEFSPNLSVFAELGVNQNDSFRQLAPSPDAFTLPVGHNSNPYPFAVPISYRFLDVGARIDTIDSRTTRGVIGVKGTFKDWDWELAAVDGHNEITQTGSNYISVPVRATLVTNNIYSFVNPSANDPAIAAGLRISPVRTGDSKIRSYDGKLSGAIMELPAGPLSLAAGAEYRRESVADTPDPLGAAGLIVGSGGTFAEGSRTMRGIFGELSIPITRDVEAQVAIRHENYSDYGTSTVPKYAVSYRMTPTVLLRAGYDEGFRAPSLSQLYQGQTISFNAIVDPVRCNGYRAAFGASDPRTSSACAALQTRTTSGGNPDLTAEESKSSNFGLIWDVTPRFSAAFDLYRISHTGRIATPNLNFLVANENLFPGGVVRDPQTSVDVLAGTPGPIVGTASDTRSGLNVFYFNAQSQSTRGIDAEFRYRAPLGSWGDLQLTSVNSYIEYFRRSQAPGQVPAELAGNDGLPRYRGTHSAVWNKAAWEASLAIIVVGGYRQPLQPITGVDLSVPSWTTADVQLSWSGIKYLKFIGGIRNVADKEPPFYNNQSSGGYDSSLHNLYGRFYYGRVTVTF